MAKQPQVGVRRGFAGRVRWAVAGAALAAAVVPVLGQLRVRTSLDRAADANDGQATPPGVSVPDSPGAVERLNNAKEKEAQKQWNVAGEFYQEVLAKYAGRVVPDGGDPANGVYHFAGLAPLVQERLAKWPPEGLNVYRARYGTAAADALAAAKPGDTAAVQNVFWTYFATDAGKAAGVRLLDADLEAGDFPAAAYVGQRLLTLHPALGGDYAAVLFRTATALHWTGDDAAAGRLLDQLRGRDPKAVGHVGGWDVPVVDAVAAMLAAPAPAVTPGPDDADTYPSFGGPFGRGEVSPSTALPGATLNPVLYQPRDPTGAMGQQQKNQEGQDRTSWQTNQGMGVVPVVDAGTVFFQDGRALYAVDADTGEALPGWLATYPGDRRGRYQRPVPGWARGEQLTVTVAPTGVYAVMGQPDKLAANNPYVNNGMVRGGMVGADGTPPPTTVRLVGLDRATGRERWVRSPADLPESVGSLRTGDYGGTPLYLPPGPGGGPAGGDGEGSVLVGVRAGKENQFDECYVVCLSAATGKYRWSAYAGSATRPGYGDAGPSADPAQLSYADGRVFVMTNVGTVAALDPADGRMIWLDAYARDAATNDPNDPPQFRRGRFMGDAAPSPPSQRPWARNPVVVADGHVFVLPSDSRALYVYDAGSGAQVKRLPTSAYEAADVLLGVKDGAAVLVGDNAVNVVPWRTATPDHPTPAGYRREHNAYGGVDVKIVGRGFLTDNWILLTTSTHLVRLDWRTLKSASTFPANGTFQTDGLEPGNVLATTRDVVVAGQHRVYVFTNLDLIRERFEGRIAAAPTDPEPRIRYADALLAAGRPADAIARIDDAVRVAAAADGGGGGTAPRPGSARQMIFANVLEFAGRSAKQGEAVPGAVGFTDALYDRAAAAAATPAERARYALSRGDAVAARKGDPAEVAAAAAAAVDLYQTILVDPAERDALASDDQTAGTAARLAIGRLADADPSSYATVEKAAGTALADARAADDPERLLAVANAYPNSRAAREARETAVNRFEASNQFGRTIDALRQGFTTTPATRPDERAAFLVGIAANELALPDGIGPAVDRLSAAARLAPNMPIARDLVLPDGRTLRRPTFAVAIAALRELQAAADTARLPTYGLAKGVVNGYLTPNQMPLVPTPSAVIRNVTALVHPIPAATRSDQLATWSRTGGFAVYPVGQTTPAVSLPGVDRPPISAAFVADPPPATASGGGPTTGPAAADGRWVVWTPSGVYGATADGKPAWQLSLAGLGPAPDVLAGDVVYEGVHNNGDGSSAASDDNLNGRAVVGGNGQIIFNGKPFKLRNGRWVQVAPPVVVQPEVVAPAEEQVDRAVLAGRRLVVTTSAGRVFAVDAGTGRVDWQAKVSADRPVDELLAGPRFVVVRLDETSGSQLAVLEAATGRLVGRRRFGADGAPNQLVNAALSEDATLVFTLARQVLTVDLDDPWRTPAAEVPVPRHLPDTMAFTGMTQPAQLLAAGGRVVVLYASPGGGPMARGFDLSGTTDPTNPLETGAAATDDASPAVSLQLVGPQLFVVHPAGFHRYNLNDAKADHAGGGGDQLSSGRLPGPVRIADFLIGKDYVMAVNCPVDRGPDPAPVIQVLFLDRASPPGKSVESDADVAESLPIKPGAGRPQVAATQPVTGGAGTGGAGTGGAGTTPAGTTDWVAVDGGFAYLTGRQTLNLLPCNRSAPTGAP